MTVVRYEPWALVSRLQKEVDRLFGAPLTTAADSGAWLAARGYSRGSQSVRSECGSTWRRSKGSGNHLRSGRADDSRTARGFTQGVARGFPTDRAHQRRVSSAASACRRARTPRTSRRSSPMVCWKSQFPNRRKCSRTRFRSKPPNGIPRVLPCNIASILARGPDCRVRPHFTRRP